MLGGVKGRSTEIAGNAINRCVLAAIGHTEDSVCQLMSSTLHVMSRTYMYKEERACNCTDIEILDVTKNRFKIAFPVEQSIRTLDMLAAYW